MGSSTVIPPLPDGFQLDNTSSSTLPPLPDGFQVQDNNQGAPKVSSNGLIDLRQNGQGLDKSVEELTNLAGNSVLKTATGKGFEDRLTQDNGSYNPKTASIPDIIGHNFQKASLGTIGNVADMATSPIGLLFAAEKPIANAVDSAGSMFNKVKNNIANKSLNQEFAQNKSDWQYNHDARRVAKSMPDIIGPDLNSTTLAVDNKVKEVGQAIGDTINSHTNSDIPINATEAVFKPFDDKISELNIENPTKNATAIKRLEEAKQGLIDITNSDGKVVGKNDLANTTPSKLWDFRQKKIDPATKFTGNVSDDAVVNQAYQDARHNIKTLINDKIPEVKPLNQDYGDLTSLSSKLDNIAFKHQKEGLPSLKFQDLLTLGANRFLANPVNKLKFAQWLYTTEPQEVAALAKDVPNLKEAIIKVYGKTEIPRLPSPKTVTPETPSYLKDRQNIPEAPFATKSKAEPFIRGNPNTKPIPMNGQAAPKVPALPAPLPKYLQERQNIPPLESSSIPLRKEAMVNNTNPSADIKTFKDRSANSKRAIDLTNPEADKVKPRVIRRKKAK